MNFIHYLIIAIIVGLITIFGRIIAVRWTEYYRLRAILKAEFEETIIRLQYKIHHPVSYVQNDHIDTLVEDILEVIPPWKRFRKHWEEYRYDKQIRNMPPLEYTQESPDCARKLIIERIHNLISKL